MGTILASSLITRASRILQDTTNTRWTETELLDWLNDGQREIVLLKPDSNTKNEAMAIAKGTTKQTIPTGGLVFIDITRNLGTSSSSPTSGRAVTVISRKILDNQLPEWHSSTYGATSVDSFAVKHYVFDERDPKHFYIYPFLASTVTEDWYVEVVYSSAPDDVENTTDAISLDDIYANALIDYMLYRAYSKDAEYTKDMQMAISSYNSFARSLGILNANEMANNPNIPFETREQIEGKIATAR